MREIAGDDDPLAWQIPAQQELINMLIENGAGVNAKNKYRETPLALAIENSSKEIVQLLVSKGAKKRRFWR
ncbi:MAG: ankyrin repeat domain-containing protein [bacterium]